jgi:hypothetical protein
MPKRSPKAKGGRKTVPTTRSEREMVRKTLDVDQFKLDGARETLGTTTDTETIDRALDRVILAAELSAGLEALAVAGGLESFESHGDFDRDVEVRRPAT